MGEFIKGSSGCMKLGPEGIYAEGVHGRSFFRWAAFARCVELTGGFALVYRASVGYLYICKKYFPGTAIPDIRKILASHVRMSRA